MKIRIGSGESAIERDVPIPASPHKLFADRSLAARRARVRDLVAKNRRSRFRVIAGGLPTQAK
jgi:hypothetical protein